MGWCTCSLDVQTVNIRMACMERCSRAIFLHAEMPNSTQSEAAGPSTLDDLETGCMTSQWFSSCSFTEV